MHTPLVLLLQDLGSDAPPWLYLGMAGALAAMGSALLAGGKGWIDKCETRAAGHLARVDKMIEADAEKTIALKQANDTAIRATDITEKMVDAMSALTAKMTDHERKTDATLATVATIEKGINELARSDAPVARRRT